MAKTLAKISANKNFQAHVKEIEEENKRLVKRLDEMREEKGRAWDMVADWRKKAESLERDCQGLAGNCERLKERIRMIEDNNNRLLGWVDAKLGRQPQLESEVPF